MKLLLVLVSISTTLCIFSIRQNLKTNKLLDESLVRTIKAESVVVGSVPGMSMDAAENWIYFDDATSVLATAQDYSPRKFKALESGREQRKKTMDLIKDNKVKLVCLTATLAFVLMLPLLRLMQRKRAGFGFQISESSKTNQSSVLPWEISSTDSETTVVTA